MAYNADVYFQEFKKNYKIGSKEPDSCLVAVIAQPSDHTLKFWKNLKHLTTHILYEKKKFEENTEQKIWQSKCALWTKLQKLSSQNPSIFQANMSKWLVCEQRKATVKQGEKQIEIIGKIVKNRSIKKFLYQFCIK